MCAAPVGNQFWKMRSSHGRKPIFSDPEQLWEACQEYFEWVQDTPLYEAKAMAVKTHVEVVSLPKMRAMTIVGLCIFLDIDRTTWMEYGRREDFSKTVARVEDIIYSQKFEGAAADLLNPNIIARDLGLADKKEHSGKVTLEDLIVGEKE